MAVYTKINQNDINIINNKFKIEKILWVLRIKTHYLIVLNLNQKNLQILKNF